MVGESWDFKSYGIIFCKLRVVGSYRWFLSRVVIGFEVMVMVSLVYISVGFELFWKCRCWES